MVAENHLITLNFTRMMIFIPWRITIWIVRDVKERLQETMKQFLTSLSEMDATADFSDSSDKLDDEVARFIISGAEENVMNILIKNSARREEIRGASENRRSACVHLVGLSFRLRRLMP